MLVFLTLVIMIGLGEGKEKGEMINLLVPIAGRFINGLGKVITREYIKQLYTCGGDIEEKLVNPFRGTPFGEECSSLKDPQELEDCCLGAYLLLHSDEQSECGNLFNNTDPVHQCLPSLMMNIFKNEIGMAWLEDDIWFSFKRLEAYKHRMAKGLCIFLQRDMDMNADSELRSLEQYQVLLGNRRFNNHPL
jgi:hypothetical protein